MPVFLITFNSSRHFDFSQDAFSKLRAFNFDKGRTKVAKKKCELTKVLFKVVKNKKSIFFSYRYLIEFSETNRISRVPHLYDVANLLK